jgi:hypothetical protein
MRIAAANILLDRGSPARAPRAAARRGALLWEVDPRALWPSAPELSLLSTWCSVGESPNLDRLVLTIELDRQKLDGIACRAAP